MFFYLVIHYILLSKNANRFSQYILHKLFCEAKIATFSNNVWKINMQVRGSVYVCRWGEGVYERVCYHWKFEFWELFWGINIKPWLLWNAVVYYDWLSALGYSLKGRDMLYMSVLLNIYIYKEKGENRPFYDMLLLNYKVYI